MPFAVSTAEEYGACSEKREPSHTGKHSPYLQFFSPGIQTASAAGVLCIHSTTVCLESVAQAALSFNGKISWSSLLLLSGDLLCVLQFS